MNFWSIANAEGMINKLIRGELQLKYEYKKNIAETMIGRIDTRNKNRSCK